MSNVDLYAQALKRGHAGTRLEPQSPAEQVEKLRPAGELGAAEPLQPAGGIFGAGSRSLGEILARLRRIFGEVELVEEPGVNTVNRSKGGKA